MSAVKGSLCLDDEWKVKVGWEDGDGCGSVARSRSKPSTVNIFGTTSSKSFL